MAITSNAALTNSLVGRNEPQARMAAKINIRPLTMIHQSIGCSRTPLCRHSFRLIRALLRDWAPAKPRRLLQHNACAKLSVPCATELRRQCRNSRESDRRPTPEELRARRAHPAGRDQHSTRNSRYETSAEKSAPLVRLFPRPLPIGPRRGATWRLFSSLSKHDDSQRCVG